MNEFPGITHLAVSVSDLTRSVPWYTALFGTEPVLDEDVPEGGFRHVVYALAGGRQLFGLHQHHRQDNAAFDEHRAGLDHVSFACPDRAGLEEWAGRLAELGVLHAGIVDAHYGSGLAFRDPDGIALEFFAPPRAE